MMNPIILSLAFLVSFQLSANTKVDEKLFQRIGDKIVELHQDKIDKKGWTLNTEADWEEESIQAYASTRNSPYYAIYYTGGLIKAGLGTDGLSLVLCHEIGHLFGKKMKSDKGSISSAVEGEADYYSTNVCLRKLWAKNTDLIADPILVEDQVYLNNRFKGDLYSIRAAAASLQVLRALGDKTLSADATDISKLRTTKQGYPSVKCRLATYYAGIENHKRPKCWFNGW